MKTEAWTEIKHNHQIGVELLHAKFIQHAYPRHSHDYYVISLIQRGNQSFTHKGTKQVTPPGGLILINPEVVHTGETVDEQGFELRSLYPTVSHMQTAFSEMTGHSQEPPFFTDVRVDDPWLTKNILSLHKALSGEVTSLESESRFIWTMAQLIKRYTDVSSTEQKPGNENKAIQKARLYLEEYFSEGVSLNQLAGHVALSPYYFLRAFCAEVGMPPHAYLESVRIRHAQKLIRDGKSLIDVAMVVGFSSQSHLTHCFKKIIGVTPGQYARQLQS